MTRRGAPQITAEQLMSVFESCGPIILCRLAEENNTMVGSRVTGHAPHRAAAARGLDRSAAAYRRAPPRQLVQMNRARFAFIEFEDPQSARSCPRGGAALPTPRIPAGGRRLRPVLSLPPLPPSPLRSLACRDGAGPKRHYSGGQAGQVRPRCRAVGREHRSRPGPPAAHAVHAGSQRPSRPW